jgi:excisionase family DNA binding protein
MEILNTTTAAEKLNVSAIRVRQLIREGRLPAQKIGRDYIIQEKDLALVANRQTGRPAKNEKVRGFEKDAPPPFEKFVIEPFKTEFAPGITPEKIIDLLKEI